MSAATLVSFRCSHLRVKLLTGLFGDKNWSTLGAFVLACLGGAAWMRLIVRQWVIEPGAFFGLGSLLIGCLIAWIALQHWRRSAPNRCAVIVGLCGGVAGAGFVILLKVAS